MKRYCTLIVILLSGCGYNREDMEIEKTLAYEKGLEEGYEIGYEDALKTISSGRDVESEMKYFKIKNIELSTWSDLPYDYKVDIIETILEKKGNSVPSTEIDSLVSKIDNYKEDKMSLYFPTIEEVLDQLRKEDS